MSRRGAYAVLIKRSAEKEVDRLSPKVFNRVVDAILRLEANPRPRGSTKLRGAEGYRLRIGPYRVLYIVDDARKVVEVVAVGHRREVYRGL